MRVLVACEESGVVREAFRNNGHDAYSCDILESSHPSPYHIQGDVSKILDDGWDLIVAHPPCTHLAVSGARWFPEKIKNGTQQAAIDFALMLWGSSCQKLALENPVSILSTVIRKPDQIIQPWMFGHEATKTTCLWLKGLPPLIPTQIVGKGESKVFSSGRKMQSWYNLPPSPNRAKLRSKTFYGIAQAMADQWGS